MDAQQMMAGTLWGNLSSLISHVGIGIKSFRST